MFLSNWIDLFEGEKKKFVLVQVAVRLVNKYSSQPVKVIKILTVKPRVHLTKTWFSLGRMIILLI